MRILFFRLMSLNDKMIGFISTNHLQPSSISAKLEPVNAAL